MKIFFLRNVTVLLTANSHGSPSPATSKGYLSTSSSIRYRTGIELNPLEVPDELTINVAPLLNCFIETLCGKSLEVESLSPLNAKVPSIIGLILCKTHFLNISMFG